MRESIKECNSELLSLFLDKELGKEEYSRVEDHIRECPACKKKLHELASLSKQFKEFINERTLPPVDQMIEDQVLNRIDAYKIPIFKRLKDILLSKKVVVTAASISAVVIFLLFFWQSGDIEPTAIVKSVSGDVSSIYIMETPGTRQTILWFNERPERKT